MLTAPSNKVSAERNSPKQSRIRIMRSISPLPKPQQLPETNNVKAKSQQHQKQQKNKQNKTYKI